MKYLKISSIFFFCGCLLLDAEEDKIISTLISESDVIIVGEFSRPVEMLVQDPDHSFFLFRVLVTNVIKNDPYEGDGQRYALPVGEVVKVVYQVNAGDLTSKQLSIPKGDRFDGVFFLRRNFNQLEALNPWLYYLPRSQILEQELLRQVSASAEKSARSPEMKESEPPVADPFE